MGSITINSNIASLNAQRRLGQSTNSLRDSFTRLSSGLRINRASDDASGLAIAESLKADQRVYTQGVRNLNDGVSLFSIADGALTELSSITIRLSELAEQAANGALSNAQRGALDEEAQALKAEYLRIAQTTEFNGQKLLTGETAVFNLQAGIGTDAILSGGVGGAIGTGSFDDTIGDYLSEARVSREVDLGDLNGDGFLDLVTAGEDDSTNGYATVRLGDGTGSFGAATSYAAESDNTYSVELADLNGDGVLDLITGGEDDSNNGAATVRLGDGTGGFGEANSFATEANQSRDVTLVDLNGDGNLDLISAGQDGANGFATIRLGDGTGSFGAATSYAGDDRVSQEAEVGDVNGDGILDLVTAGRGAGSNGTATVRLGLGGGEFAAGTTTIGTEGFASYGLELGDINGDGVLDLVTAGQDGSYNGFATVRLGDGEGSFGAAKSYTSENRVSRSLALGDLNGDGFLDLVTGGPDDSPFHGHATVRLGDGTGTFGAATSFEVQANGPTRALKLGDLNGDGVLDIATAGDGASSNGSVAVRLGATVDGVAPLLDFSLETMAGARQALPVFKQKLDQLSSQRGEIGAFMSRVDVATNVLNVTRENYLSAESRIRDADVAVEAAGLVRNQILQQAGAAILAQANQGPALALALLG